ncbi:MAG TPA: FAD-binding oxidoreductase [Candidatus Limnocylindrales bacterium]|nr:FAD-binding oxidoreductase [Candidatus Limnocylindrales bacterium]
MSAAKANGTSAAETSAARPRLDLAAFPSLGPGQLRPGRDVDEIDGMLPQAVITAREPAHVIATIEEARAKRLGVVTSGGATMLHIGAPPRAYDVRLSMTAIGRILEQNPEDMTVICEAGVSLSRLQRSLAKVGQRVAIDAAIEDRASIGGILATNATGGLRHGFGLPRDLVLGMTAIDGCGRTLVCGGRVVKNVAGYDLVRLLTGSWGGLAIITQATLRTHPLPEAGATLVFEFVSPAELDAARGRLLGQSLPLAAVDFAVDMSEATMLWILAVRVEGTEQEVAVQGDRVCAAVGRQPSDAVEDWTSPAHIDAPGGATLRIATPPASIVGTVRSVLGKLKETASRLGRTPLLVAGHLGAGIARFHLASSSEDAGGSAARPAFGNPVDVAALQSLLAATEPDGVIATRVIERAPVSIKQGHQVWGAPPASLPLMRAVKRRLDPADALSPGRFVGGL